MAQSVNWLFIVLGIALGGPAGYGACLLHHRVRRGRSKIRAASAELRMIAYGFGGIVLLSGAGLIYLGVL